MGWHGVGEKQRGEPIQSFPVEHDKIGIRFCHQGSELQGRIEGLVVVAYINFVGKLHKRNAAQVRRQLVANGFVKVVGQVIEFPEGLDLDRQPQGP